MTSWLFVTLSVICAWKEPNIYYEPPSRPELTTMHMDQLRDLAGFRISAPLYDQLLQAATSKVEE